MYGTNHFSQLLHIASQWPREAWGYHTVRMRGPGCRSAVAPDFVREPGSGRPTRAGSWRAKLARNVGRKHYFTLIGTQTHCEIKCSIHKNFFRNKKDFKEPLCLKSYFCPSSLRPRVSRTLPRDGVLLTKPSTLSKAQAIGASSQCISGT